MTTAAVGLTYAGVFGAFGVEGRPKATAATIAPTWARATADGFASLDAPGQNGTYGGRDGALVTVTSLADLEKYATASKPYVIVVAGTITPKGKEIEVATTGRNESGGATFDS
ncbi:hypothetical protein [Streptomyces sp. A1136]|uniref:hypothetical protein n=1 Tax=Streptomyces sp. A1136 TaxID=2563102 RepID=UPI0019D0689A|nr:hypothetical protein [Streptomyces sp. A1136]